eukprot:CAMPEP_0179348634 /NCGR_PEP_ID=MMETSP0797-20121207/73806_1 /TAXON_ID=47934 /ORGANISM="Dinophysis acuminata, Strain DAEP01" /LENGTH=240 /DNA_ID=CAMNT_0021063451 /DNA_START=43 /DNA_END=762 /DNA_ORIENTATION=+
MAGRPLVLAIAAHCAWGATALELRAGGFGAIVGEAAPQSPPTVFEEEDLPVSAMRVHNAPTQFVDPSPPTAQSINMHATRGKPLEVIGGYEIGTPWLDPNQGLWLPVSFMDYVLEGEMGKRSLLGRSGKKMRVQRHWVKTPVMVGTPTWDEATKRLTTKFFPQLEATTATGKGGTDQAASRPDVGGNDHDSRRQACGESQHPLRGQRPDIRRGDEEGHQGPPPAAGSGHPRPASGGAERA